MHLSLSAANEALGQVNTDHLYIYDDTYVAELELALELMDLSIADENDAAAVAMAECCELNNYACSCYYDFCSRSFETVDQTALPDAFEALGIFMPRSVALFKRHELAMLDELARNWVDLSPSTADWSARYVYLQLHLHCREMGLEVAYALMPAFHFCDQAEVNCQLDQACDSAQEQARQEEIRRAIEEARQAEEAALLVEAEAPEICLDPNIRGELCLDSAGCLGMDGSKVTVKLGGVAFAALTVDTAQFGLGVRVGVGISDPTGNLASADISLGAEITANGSNVNIQQSQSYIAGMFKKEQTFYLLRSQFKN